MTKEVVEVAECNWAEPFILYYNDECCESQAGEEYSTCKLLAGEKEDESLLKFTIQMGYDELN